MALDAEALERGARNLILGCAGASPGERLLIIREDPGHGYFREGLAEAVAGAAQRLGLLVRTVEAPFDPDADRLSPDLEAEVRGSDHALFLARLGDQLRFKAMPPGSRPIVSYALDREALASAFGTAPYQAFLHLKSRFNALFGSAGSIRVTCPRGTDYSGAISAAERPDEPADVAIKRFPMSVFAPIDAAGFSGRIAVAQLLVGTGSRYYQPYGIALHSTLLAHVSRGRLLHWEGPPGEVARAEAHYGHVAGLFGIDAGFVHSWHAGIHPGCGFPGSAHDAYERWSGSAFGNPRLLHFHTCGAYAPGEICWNIVDPTVEVDGVVIWEAGRIRIERVPGAAAILDSHPELRALFEAPDRRTGLETGP